MKLDPSSLRITERQVEDFFYQDPQSVCSNRFYIEKWIKRQYRVPSGIVDLLGITSSGDLAVVEIKNVEVDSRAVTQVCRYAKDIEGICGAFNEREATDNGVWMATDVVKILVGPSVSDSVFRECEACGVIYLEFSINMTVDVNSILWSSDFLEDRKRYYGALSQDQELKQGIRDCYETRKRNGALFMWKTEDSQAAEGDPS